MVTVQILAVAKVGSKYGYSYNTTYIVTNHNQVKFAGTYKNLSSAISTSTANNAIATTLVSSCSGCYLSSSLTFDPASTTMTLPAYVQTPTPTSSPTYKPSGFPIFTPTVTPTSPSVRPTLVPTSPSVAPSKKPSLYPSVKPSLKPSLVPSIRSLAPTNQGLCFCNVRICFTMLNVTRCDEGPATDVYH